MSIVTPSVPLRLSDSCCCTTVNWVNRESDRAWVRGKHLSFRIRLAFGRKRCRSLSQGDSVVRVSRYWHIVSVKTLKWFRKDWLKFSRTDLSSEILNCLTLRLRWFIIHGVRVRWTATKKPQKRNASGHSHRHRHGKAGDTKDPFHFQVFIDWKLV